MMQGMWVTDISEDGQWVLLCGSGPVPGIEYKIYLQRTDGSPPVLIGEGGGWARLSPDGKHVLTGSLTDRTRIRLLPTGPGTARDLPAFDLKERRHPLWTPDGRGIIFFGMDASGRRRLYAQPLDQGPPRPFGRTYVMPPGLGNVVSPDGRWVVAQDNTGAWGLEAVDDAESRAIPQINSNESVRQWTADSHSLYVASYAANSIVLDKLHIATGRRTHVATLNPVNVAKAADLFLNRRATAWVYTLQQWTMDIYLVDFPAR